MTDQPQEDWNPLDASVQADQRKAYDQMRERCPVAHSQFMQWSVFRHADIAAVLADPQTFINASHFPAIPNGLNPPVHGVYNQAVGEFFKPQQMTKLEPRVRQITTDLLAPLLGGDAVDFISGFIRPFALKSQCAQLGWPEQQWQALADWVHGNQQVALSGDAAAGKALADSFAALVKANLNAHRVAPPASDDATTGLLNTVIDGKQLSDDEIVTILRNWVAGHGTVVDALSIVVLHVASDPTLQARLRQEPALIAAAIEEILRADGPLVANRRTTTREVEIGGRTLPKAATLSLMWIAANRDPRAFADPDTIKLERNTATSMVWGQGIHFCLGAPLGRMEMRVAVEALLASTAKVELADPAPLRQVYPGNGLATLIMRLTRR